MDPRKKHIAKAVLDHLASGASFGDQLDELCRAPELEEFLDDFSKKPLQASLMKGSEKISFSTSVMFDANSMVSAVVITKTMGQSITESNMNTALCFTTLRDSVAVSLYENIHNVFAPLLQKDSEAGEALRNLLNELDSALGSVVRRKGGRTDGRSKIDETNVSGILSVQDEISFFQDAIDMGSPKDRAFAIIDALKEIVKEVEGVKLTDDPTDAIFRIKTPLEQLMTVSDRISSSQPYPQVRMSNILKIVGDMLSEKIRSYLSQKQNSLWTSPINQCLPSVEGSIIMLKQWDTDMQYMTSSKKSAAFWKGDAFNDPRMKSLGDRLQEMVNIRREFDELQRLISAEEQRDLSSTKAFDAFTSTNVLALGKYGDQQWKAAKEKYNAIISPIEQQATEQLRSVLGGSLLPALQDAVSGRGSSAAQPQQLISELRKYTGLINRPTIRSQLPIELERITSYLKSYVTSLRDAFECRDRSTTSSKSGRNMPEIVQTISWATQMLSKLEASQLAAKDLLQGSGDLPNRITDLTREVQQYRSELFKAWSEDALDALDDPKDPIALKTSGRIMDIRKSDGMLVVHYSERLVQLLREARQLSSMGFRIPNKLESAMETANKFYRHGVMLKQVANFYNTLSTQIIQSQMPILRDDAMAFDRIIKDQKARADGTVVTWDNPQQLEAYIERLNKVTEELTAKNRALRKVHSEMSTAVIQLMNTDLVRFRDKWREGINAMRSKIEAIERQGFTNTKAWKTHWDYQLYKALEVQFNLGLERCHETLPQIDARLVFKQQRLQFEPPFEELRGTYYREIKKFVNIPSLFKGVGDSPEIFRGMVDRNPQGLKTVYLKAENLFQRLMAVQDEFAEWVVLGCVDLDEIVTQSCKEAADWENNYRILKNKSRDCDKLRENIRLDCIQVNCSAIRASIDNHLKLYASVLIQTLRRSSEKLMQDLEAFVQQALEKLSTVPQTIEEVTETTIAWTEITSAILQQRNIKRDLEDRNRLLKAMGSAPVESPDLQARWDDLELRLSAHESMVEGQKDRLKELMSKRIGDFNVDVRKFLARWKELKPKEAAMRDFSMAKQTAGSMKEWKSDFDELRAVGTRISADCEQFKMTPPMFDALVELEDDLEKTAAAWMQFELFVDELDKLATEDWISFRDRMHDFEDLLLKWNEKLRASKGDPVARSLMVEVDRLRGIVPYLKFVKGEAFQPDHWAQLFRLLSFPKTINKIAQVHFSDFLAAADAIVEKADQLKHLAAQAVGELTIRQAFDEVDAWEADAEFSVLEHRDVKGNRVVIVKEWREIMTQVGDHQSMVQGTRDSPFFSAFADRAEKWDKKLGALSSIIQNLQVVQRKWLYLEPIFGRGALPLEQNRFQKVDDEFRNIVARIESDPRVSSLCQISNLQDELPSHIDQLERCQKALTDFLEEKRSKFPRFYFIGDDDLLEILGQAQNPSVIQSHLKKLFQGIHSVKFTEKSDGILAMESLEGELVKLDKMVPVTDKVEEWMSDLSMVMVSTLRNLLAKCLKEENIREQPSQIVCAADLIMFSAKLERAIAAGSINDVEAEIRKKLADYTKFDTGSDVVLSLKLKAIIFDMIHNLDVISQVKTDGTRNPKDWVWQKQLRFYSDATAGCIIRMSDALFDYTFEYQGNAPKLVHTPLTDRCYLTLTQGMHLGFGGNPFGPAGTGKTESVKALGMAFGRQVLVFNCDEGIDYKSMGRIFMGLVKCGAWGCFDEFNRLEEDVLSAVSQQIQIIQAALKSRQEKLELLGHQIAINKNSGIFVTLNPAGKGYGGRSKLPDNLKQLFRSVAMAVPDNALIAEVILSSEGFLEAKQLGQKVVSLFTLSKQLLSRQQHYDWGLRALKTILTTAGQLFYADKQAQQQAGKGATPISKSQEEELLIKAVLVNTLAKLTFGDTQRFKALIRDLFPGTPISDVEYLEVEAAVKETLKEMRLEEIPQQIRKIVQLFEALNRRMGVVIVGPSGCGKSTLLKVLRAALAKRGKKIKQHVMNPKAIPRQQLLGHMDLDTREWFDGVLTSSAREVVKETKETHSWIVCDGDIDPEWVESLNSVLDDNRLLTMPSGERIRFGPNVNFVFETNDLKFASPATVSRMGMIFLSDEDMDVKCLVQSWIRMQPEALQVRIQPWVDQYFDAALKATMAHRAFVVATTRIGLVNSVLSHLAGCEHKEQFVVGLINGFGANLEQESRQRLAEEIFSLTGEKAPEARKPLDTQFDPRSKLLRTFQPEVNVSLTPDDMIYTSPLERDLPPIRTVDLQRNTAVFMPWLLAGEPILLVGPEGCGKSLLLRSAFGAMGKATEVATVHCSAQTNASHVIEKIVGSCSLFTASHGRVYRPRSERLILYLKDLNLPKPDKYDTIQVIAFLQQLISFKGFYDGLEWVGIERIQVVASINPATTVGRHVLSTRFTAITRIASVNYAPTEQLVQVFSAYLGGVLVSRVPKSSTWSDKQNITKLATSMMQVYEKTKQQFTVDDNRHYIFTPRDVSSWVVGLLRYDVSAINVLAAVQNEGQRIFRDRLVDASAASRFDSSLNYVLRDTWKFTVEGNRLYSSLAPSASGGGGAATGGGGAASEYAVRGIGDIEFDDWSTLVAQALQKYSREVKDLEMLLFPDILERIARLDRVLSQPGGSLLLVGRSGVGRKSCVTLVAHMLRMEVYTPKIGRGYGMKQFLNDLKVAVVAAGVNGEQTAILLEDFHFSQSSFLEAVNSLLSSGEMSGMFTHQEIDTLVAPLKESYASQGFRFRNIYSYFLNRVQRNLHVIVSMDPTHPDFVLRCESNPALYMRTTIMWLDQWSKSGMQEVSKMLLSATLNRLESASHSPDHVVGNLIEIHNSCKERGATPRVFVTLLHTFDKILGHKQKGLEQQMGFLKGGLSKLTEAKHHVDTLSQEAQQQQMELTEKQSAADAALQEITQNMKIAAEQKTEAEELGRKQEQEKKIIQQKQAMIQDQLREVQPMLEAAQSAVGSIKKQNLNELRSLNAPPEAIRDVLVAVLRLMGNFDESWMSMRRFLSQTGVVQEILNFDTHKITKEIRSSVQQHLNARAASFVKENIFRVSQAAGPLAEWVKAQIEYSAVLEKTAPLEAELDEATTKMEVANTRFIQCQESVQRLDEQVATLKNKFSQLTTEAERCRAKLEQAMGTLTAANSLLSKLHDEQSRWDTQLQGMQQSMATLPLHAMGAAGFVTYLGSAPEDVRSKILEMWRKILNLEQFSFLEFISTESEQLKWKAENLPADILSIENAAAILHCRPFPLIVDPSSQAALWLQTHLKEKGSVEITTQQDERFLNTLEVAVRFGKTLIVQEVDALEPVIVPLLRKDLSNQGPRRVVAIGEKTVDFNEDFKLYLVSRNSHLRVDPDTASLVCMVNFSVTRSGLEGQLLGATIQHEKPELEHRKSELLRNEEALKMKLAELEKNLLEQLAKSEGNILENKVLIQGLNETKASSIQSADALAQSMKLQQSLDGQRDVYRPLAATASKMYFLIQDLQAISPMYQFDLPTFLSLFKHTLETGNPAEEVSAHLTSLVTALKKSVYAYVSRSLFIEHRLTFGMHLVAGLHAELFRDNEWNMFVGNLPTKSDNVSIPPWVPKDRNAAFATLCGNFASLAQALGFNDADTWDRWIRKPQPEAEFPARAQTGTRAFQRLLVVQALRPDRLESAMEQMVCEVLGLRSVNPPPLNLNKLATEETTSKTPVLFISTPGADPNAELQEVAERIVGLARYHQIAMGQGQTDEALQKLREAAKQGDWVMLKNVHLVISWLHLLEKELHSMTKPAETFRLWMTTEIHSKFPPILLQQSLKVTYEAPPGIKKNLQRTLESWPTNYLSKGNSARAQLLFILAWFHAVVQERRNYIPQGWSKFHEYSVADLRSGCDIIDSMKEDIQWPMIHGLLEQAIYGGRVDNGQDILVLRAYLLTFFKPENVGSQGGVKEIPMTKTRIPSGSSHGEYVAVVNELPDNDAPSLFGLPSNIDRMVQIVNSGQVITNLNRMMAADMSIAVFDRQRWAAQLEPILSMWATLSQTRGLLKEIKAEEESSQITDPISTFVLFECALVHNLARKVHASMEAIGKVLRGSELLTSGVYKAAQALLSNECPSDWIQDWEGPEVPQKWITSLVSKATAIDRWYDSMKSGSLLPGPLDLSALLQPLTFLNALRQQTARKANVSMDRLKLVCGWDATAEMSSAVLPCGLTGLLLQGATFGSQLTEAQADTPNVVLLPQCRIAYVPQDAPDAYQATASVKIPVYESLGRQAQLMELAMPCRAQEQNRWILAGVAICLSVD